MKKILLVMGIYIAIILLVCMCLSGFTGISAILLEGTERSYRFMRGFSWFLSMLPAILLSGFSVACSVIWKKNAGNSQFRFSPAMFARFRIVMILSVCISFILTMNNEFFMASMNKKIEKMENANIELSEAITTTRKLLNQNEFILALQYAKKAIEIAPKNEAAKGIFKEAKDALDLMKDQEIYSKKKKPSEPVKISRPVHEEDKAYSILELLEKSAEASANKQWFSAHYWAQLALEACSGTDTIRPEAEQAANRAWKELNVPVEFDNSSEREYYSKKKEGYTSLKNGDFLKAYYIFLSLVKTKPQAEKDPDVQRFFNLAKEDVETQYFFFDEVDNMDEISTGKNIYFSLEYPDGGKCVLYIEREMVIRKNSGLVRYLENLNVARYSAEKDFIYSFSVPYAKVVGIPVTEFSEETMKALGFNKSWKYIPSVCLQSVDRNTEGLVSKPVFSRKPTELPKSFLAENRMYYLGESDKAVNHVKNMPDLEMENESAMLLPMPFKDFQGINEASSGPAEMNLSTLNKFVVKADRYGFAKEIFCENMVKRGTFPIIMMILCIFCAVLGWNYRIERNSSSFKFIWLVLIPFYGIGMHLLTNCVLYVFNMLNYVLVGIFGTGALMAAFVIYIVIMMIAGMNFVSRKV